jgi:hypothetical protein
VSSRHLNSVGGDRLRELCRLSCSGRSQTFKCLFKLFFKAHLLLSKLFSLVLGNFFTLQLDLCIDQIKLGPVLFNDFISSLNVLIISVYYRHSNGSFLKIDRLIIESNELLHVKLVDFYVHREGTMVWA